MSHHMASDAKRLASFKASLLELREVMVTDSLNKKWTSGSGGGSSVTSPSSPSRRSNKNNNKNNTNLNSNKSYLSWIYTEREGLMLIGACAFLGAFLGFAIGAGWFTRGAGTYQYVTKSKRILGAMSAKTGFIRKKAVRHFVVNAWRASLAKRIRKTLVYQLFTLSKSPWRIFFDFWYNMIFSNDDPDKATMMYESASTASCFWPANWVFFRDIDLSQVDLGDKGLSPFMASTLSIILPWRRSLIQGLTRKDKVKWNLRDQDGNEFTIGPSSILSFAGQSSSHPINPYYHPMAFHTLREYIIRFDNGYVHPDLGFLVPAPSGAERGLGMIRDTYTKCQVHCNPGTAEEKLKHRKETLALSEESQLQALLDAEILKEMMNEFPDMAAASTVSSASSPDTAKLSPQVPKQAPLADKTPETPDPLRNTTTYEGIQAAVQLQQQSTPSNTQYTQSEVLLRIPLEAQITRKTALETLLAVVGEQNARAFEELDDAFILAVYLAHERGQGVNSRIWPYIATLPLRPTCALHWGWQQSVVDVITAMSVEMGSDLQGWPNEISKASELSEKIVLTLSRAFGDKLAVRSGGPDVTTNIRWSLCQVASRAVAGREDYGNLRLVPMMDMINHDLAADKFTELTGKERMEDGHYLDADENQAGTFVVRSQRHGERKRLRKGQELMANYNVPAYSPLDWFINMGYVPPERAGKWTLLSEGLPHHYRGGFSRKANVQSKDPGAFGSGKHEIEVIRQHTRQQHIINEDTSQQNQQCQHQPQQQQQCSR